MNRVTAANQLKDKIFNFYNHSSNDAYIGDHNVEAFHSAYGLDVEVGGKTSLADFEKIRAIIKSTECLSISEIDRETMVIFRVIFAPTQPSIVEKAHEIVALIGGPLQNLCGTIIYVENQLVTVANKNGWYGIELPNGNFEPFSDSRKVNWFDCILHHHQTKTIKI